MLIAIEGLDGAGKTTLLESLVEHYNVGRRDTDAVVLAQPWSLKSQTYTGEVRSTLAAFFDVTKTLDDPLQLTRVAFNMLDKFAHMRNLLPSVRAGLPADNTASLVFMDRYVDSMSAYQGAQLAKLDGDIQRWTLYLDRLQRSLFPVPQVTLYLDAGLDSLSRKAADAIEILAGDRTTEAQRVLKAYDYLREERQQRNLKGYAWIEARREPYLVLRDAIRVIEHFRDQPCQS